MFSPYYAGKLVDDTPQNYGTMATRTSFVGITKSSDFPTASGSSLFFHSKV
jgi:hypothetical protein